MIYNVDSTCQVVGLADIYEKYFPSNYEGVFVEVGSYNGKDYSNVSGLAEHNWEGICIEPDIVNFSSLVQFYKNYPKIKCLPYMIGLEGKGKLYEIGGGLATGSEEQYQLYKKHNWSSGYEGFVDSYKFRLDEILEYNHISKIDVISIDVEGMELEVLQTFNIDKYQPKLAIIEAHQNHPLEGFGRFADQINKLFLDKGYEIIYSDFINNIYIRSDDNA